jgi:hypothetical protein
MAPEAGPRHGAAGPWVTPGCAVDRRQGNAAVTTATAAAAGLRVHLPTGHTTLEAVPSKRGRSTCPRARDTGRSSAPFHGFGHRALCSLLSCALQNLKKNRDLRCSKALSAVRAVPVMWEIASRFFDHFAFSPIKTDGRLLVRAMASLLFASASSQWLRLDSQEQLRRWSAGDFGEMAPLIWLRSINDLFLLSLNVVGVAGQQQQQSSAQGLGWPSCG